MHAAFFRHIRDMWKHLPEICVSVARRTVSRFSSMGTGKVTAHVHRSSIKEKTMILWQLIDVHSRQIAIINMMILDDFR
jgi:hypothetical protein